MVRNRKAFTDYVCHYLDKLLPGGGNGAYMRERLEALSPEQLDAYVDKLEKGEEILPLIVPNLHDSKISIDNNLAIAKELGLELFEKLRLTDSDTNQTYITNEDYLVMDIPVRRQRQIQRKKTSIPQGTKQVDDLSGQVTGMAKGSKVSMPELQVLYSQELTDPIIELIKYRGGDIKGQQLLYRSLMETGRASQRALAMTRTTVRSTQVLSIVLNAMHLSTTLMD